jgi:hypothetical protein
MELNFLERRRGIDRWPEVTATITNIEQPYNDPKHDFLSLVTYAFKDETGGYFGGTYQMRTSDFSDSFMTGSMIQIRYNPNNPDKSWCEDDYWRTGFGLWQRVGFPILMLSLVAVTLIALGVIFILKRQ